MTHISAAQRRALAQLAPVLPRDAYVAGGVAAAALLDHRPSLDIDVFMRESDPTDFLTPVSQLPRTTIISRARGTLELEVEEIPVSMLSFPYPDLAAPQRRAGLALPSAAPEDLTAMKLSAIAGRGTAKDFWDLHELLSYRDIDLRHSIAELERKFASQDPGSVIRSLAYFGDADADPLPRGLTSDRWESIKSDFRRWVAAL